MRHLLIFVAVCSGLLVVTGPAAAQDEAQTHVVTVTTFEVPFPELGKFWEIVDKYVMPADKANPHILSEKIASHNWGDAKKTVWFIAEYESLTELDASDDFGDKYFDEHYPEGSAARDSADTAFEEHFLKHFSGHEDNILTLNMTRSK
jgi:hypothetical protein